MVLPTRSLLSNLRLHPLPTFSEKVDDWAGYIEDDARATQRTIGNLDWSSGARDMAVDRANRESVQLNRTADAFTALATAITNGHNNLSHIRGRLQSGAQGYEGNNYKVSENWTVTDGLNYPAAERAAGNDAKALEVLEAVREARANHAATGTTNLQRLAEDFDVADTDTAAAIRTASGAIDQFAPITAGLGPALAQNLVDGVLTEEQIQALAAAAQLTPEQLEALHTGRPVNIPQGQYDFLKTLGDELDGLSIAEITQIGSQNPRDFEAIQHLLANSMQIMGMPQVQTTAGDTGGMDMLPTPVKSLLTQNPQVQLFREGGEFNYYVPGAAELSTLRGLLDKGDPQLRMGSDVNRGLLNQAARIAEGLNNPPKTEQSTPAPVGSYSKSEGTELLDDLLSLASDDTTAVRDSVTGENMGVTQSGGSEFDTDRHLDALLGHEWGKNQGGIDSMFEWFGKNTGNTDNPALARNAADTAQSLGEYFGDHGNREIATQLGEKSPYLAQTLATSFSPYLGEFVGVDHPNITNLGEMRGLNSSELVNFYAAMNTSGESSAIINEATWQWQNKLSYEFGLNPENLSLARQAGTLGEAMELGYNQQLDTLSGDAAEQFREDAENYGTLRELADQAGPGGKLLSTLMSLGGPDGPDTERYAEIARQRGYANGNEMALQMAIFEGIVASSPPNGLDKEFEDFVTDGEVDWDKVFTSQKSKSAWEDLVLRSSAGFGEVYRIGEGSVGSSLEPIEDPENIPIPNYGASESEGGDGG